MSPTLPPVRSHRPRRRRPLRGVPPLTRAVDAAEGTDVLVEVKGAAGTVLWAALRDFMLWVETPEGERGGLFGAAAGDERRLAVAMAAPEQELWAPLLTLAQMTDSPASAELSRLVYAVRAIARWAARTGSPGTRLAFTQAAAVAMADDPELALDTGRLARDLGRIPQAESWLRQAIRGARGRAWETYAWGYVGLGVLYIRTGNYPAAQTVFSRALRSARKRRLHDVEAVCLHHLFTCAAERRDVGVAYEFARAAVAAYPAGHGRIPALANDIARLWLDLGWYERALPVFKALVPLAWEPEDQIVAFGNYALAAAGSGARTEYESARAEAVRLLAQHARGPRASDVWVILSNADAAAVTVEAAKSLTGALLVRIHEVELTAA